MQDHVEREVVGQSPVRVRSSSTRETGVWFSEEVFGNVVVEYRSLMIVLNNAPRIPVYSNAPVRGPSARTDLSIQSFATMPLRRKKKRDLRVLFEKEINGRRRPKSEYIFRGKSLRV